MRKNYTKITLAFLILVCTTLHSKDNNLPDNAIEGFFTLSYSNFETDITTIIIDDTHYLPLISILTFLKIYHSPENNLQLITGFFVNQSNNYIIDFSEAYYEINNSRGMIKKEDYINGELEIFVSPDLLERVFNIKATISMLKLRVTLTSETDLPIKQEQIRENEYKFIPKTELQDYPLISNSTFTILNAGVLQYDINYDQRNNINRNSSYNLGFGGTLLGGSLNINTFGNYDFSRNLNRISNTYSLQYSFTNDYMKIVQLGDIQLIQMRSSNLSASSLRDEPIMGIMLSNESPLLIRDHFTNIKLREYIGTDWQSEVYLNGMLYSHTRSDSEGFYNFEVPISYGLSRVELRHYGPLGEYLIRHRNFNILNNFISPGSIKYSVWGGQTKYSGDYQLNGDFSMGIFTWLTNSTRLKYKHTSKELLYFNQFSASLLDNLAFSLGFNPDDGINTSLDYFTINSYLSIMHYNSSKRFDFSHFFDNSRTNLYFSVNRIANLPLSLNVNGSHNTDATRESLTISGSLMSYFSSISIKGRYRGAFIRGKTSNLPVHFLEFSLANNFSSISKFIPLIDFLRVEALTSYDAMSQRIMQSTGNISMSLFKYLNIYFGMSHDHFNRNSQLSAGLSFNTPFFKANSRASYSNTNQHSVNQQLQGIVAFAPQSLDIRFINNNLHNSNWGISNARIRFFKDLNNNGKLDSDELLINDVRVIIDSRSGSVSYGQKSIFLSNLLPNYKYNVKVDMSSFKDPIWLPKHSVFSFITEANTISYIDMPCLSSGIIDGSVRRFTNKGLVAQNRIRLHIDNIKNENKDIIPVFSDGSFYRMGIPPGKYRAQVDSMQLAILKVKSVPEFIEFEVKATEYGDFISNLNFVLFDRDSIDRWQLKRKDMIAKQIKKLKEYENRDFTGLTFSEPNETEDDTEQMTLAHSSEVIDIAAYDYFLRGFDKELPENSGMIEGKIIYETDIIQGPLSDFNVYIEGIDIKHYSKAGVFGDGSYFGNGLPPGKYRVYPAKYALDRLKCKSEPEYREIEISDNPVGDVVFNISFKLLK